MERNQWNLNRAIDWFHQHRHDGSLPEQVKRDLRTKGEIEQEAKGEYMLGVNMGLSNNFHYKL